MTEDEAEMLALAAAWMPRAGQREQAIWDRYGVSAAVFWARVLPLLDRADVEAAQPVAVHRLRRLRDRGVTRRSGQQRRAG